MIIFRMPSVIQSSEDKKIVKNFLKNLMMLNGWERKQQVKLIIVRKYDGLQIVIIQKSHFTVRVDNPMKGYP